MSKVLLFGKSGHIGVRLAELLKGECIALDRKDLDLRESEKLKDYLNALEEVPSAIIDAASYNQVDMAEEEGEEENWAVNCEAPKVIAMYCKENNIPFIYYSSDYVFDGKGTNPFDENNTVNLKPLNKFGQAKLEAEKGIRKIGGKYLIFRTSWLFNEVGKNFVKTILAIAEERQEMSIVADQFGTPTYTLDLAKHTLDILKKANAMEEFPSGIYHLTNDGFASWHQFATKILELSKGKWVHLKLKTINPITTLHYITPAKRGLNCRLSKEKVIKTFNIQLRPWEEALKECIDGLLKEEVN